MRRKVPGLRRIVGGTLVASLLLNAAFFAHAMRSGGLRRLFVKLDVVELPPPSRAAFQSETEARYRKLPNSPGEVVFAGDSLIADGPWWEFYSDIRSRGIGGDTTAGVLGRLGEITESKPRKILLLIGANDLANAVPVPVFLRHYREILAKIREETPNTEVLVLGVLPVNQGFVDKKATYDNAVVAEANRGLKALVGEFPGARFLDLAGHLANAKGELRPELSKDGLHLNLDGYLAIRGALRPFVLDSSKPGDVGAPP